MAFQEREHFVLNLARIREQGPLIHNITNHVVTNWTANCLLAIGASPVMAHALEEIPDILEHSKALLINIGTLDQFWLKSMSLAMREASRRRIPIVFDPVGAGASAYRTREALALISSHPPNVIRGNASEILALSGKTASSKGVDSLHPSESAIDAAYRLARDYGCIVSISGAVDYTVSEKSILECKYGHEIMTRVVGMGCAAGAVIAAFCAVEHSALEASHQAMCLMGRAGEQAEKKSEGTGSFQIKFLDQLSRSLNTKEENT